MHPQLITVEEMKNMLNFPTTYVTLFSKFIPDCSHGYCYNFCFTKNYLNIKSYDSFGNWNFVVLISIYSGKFHHKIIKTITKT